jgi:hypothetical protein
MPSSGMLHRVVLVRADVSEERLASFIRVDAISELRTLFLRSVLRLPVTANVEEWCLLGCNAVRIL